MNPRIPLTALAATALALGLTACGAAEPEKTPTPAAVETTPAAEPEETPVPDPGETPAGDPTCETIVSESTVKALTDIDWSYEQQDFRIGADVIEGGIQCVWGDYSVASDHVMIFGWAPLDSSASANAQQKLLSEGWLRTDDPDHVYITENPDYAVALDEDGYGMTYEFGDGWVALADTRQSLLLIDWP